jgi:DNA-nicking Smr family endonuclease
MKRLRDITPDEAKLWRKIARSINAYKMPVKKAVEGPPEVPAGEPEQAKAPPMPHLALKRAKAASAVKPQPTRPATKKPVSAPIADASGHKKVRRGKLDIDARIDLHGMRQIEAHAALAAVIARTRANNGRCILVVTGKGAPVDPGEDYITPQPGVIRRRLPEWLNGAGIREHVSGFAPANPKDGGSGAFYVLLRAVRVQTV